MSRRERRETGADVVGRVGLTEPAPAPTPLPGFPYAYRANRNPDRPPLGWAWDPIAWRARRLARWVDGSMSARRRRAVLRGDALSSVLATLKERSPLP